MKKGRKYVNKDGVNKVVSPEDLDKYLSQGWQLGNTNAAHRGITAWNKGLTKETSKSVAAIAESKRGVGRSDEFKKKVSTALAGRKLSQETKNKIAESMRGHIVTEETKNKISLANKGHILSQEAKQKISESSRGRKHTIETRLKISEKLKGKVVSEDTKRKLSEIHKNPEFQNRLNETKRQNSTFNTSTQEDLYYDSLVQIYGEEDVIRQYRDSRYPFSCDFYIKSLDLFIELNLHWTHCGHPFNSNSDEDKHLLEELQLKSKSSEYHRNAIYVWTDLDVRKQKIARENNLNYEAIYEL